jgi:GNAT superfamily N-acetyltransferase
MWADIATTSAAQLDAADAEYRRWARPRLKSGRLVGFVLETSSGKPAASGCLWMMPSQPRPVWRGTTVPYLMSMYTERDHRGRGLATRIVREAVKWSRDHGYHLLLLHASKFGKPIYERAGFERTREMRLTIGAPKKRPRSSGRKS